MRSINAIGIGAVVSALLIGTAGVLFWLARSNDPEAYRQVSGQVLRIQQLASDWSVETARARSDPLADYDALAAFIPQMRRLKEELLARVRGMPGIPDKLANDVSAYVSALDAKEERIERFKTANSVIRNSVRFLPVAASNVVEHPAADADLSREVRTLASGLNEYASTPADATKGRLTAVFERLVERVGETRAASEELADALVSFLAHSQVLLDRQAPTEEIFKQATANDVSELSNLLVANLGVERRGWEERSDLLMKGVWGVAAALMLVWILIAVMRTGPAVSPRSTVAPGVRPSAAGAVAETAPVPAAESLVANGAAVEARSSPFERRAMAQGIVVATVAGRIAEASRELAADGALGGDPAAAERLRAQAEHVADLAERLSAASAGPEARYELVNVNDAVAEAVRATGCESAAEVIVEAGEVPDVFASPAEICLMLEKVLENSAQSVRDKTRDAGGPGGNGDARGEIRIATAGDGEQATVTVIDNGVGMSAEERERMFEPLYAGRGDRAGVGLTVASHVLAKYGGRISVSSHAGAGAVTRIALPGMVDQ